MLAAPGEHPVPTVLPFRRYNTDQMITEYASDGTTPIQILLLQGTFKCWTLCSQKIIEFFKVTFSSVVPLEGIVYIYIPKNVGGRAPPTLGLVFIKRNHFSESEKRWTPRPTHFKFRFHKHELCLKKNAGGRAV